MKKRKAPILLVSLLVVLVGGIVVYGISDSRSDKPETADPSAPVTNDSRQSPSDLKDSVTASLATPSKHGPVRRDSGDSGPSIKLPDNYNKWPTPKPSSNGEASSLRPVEAAH